MDPQGDEPGDVNTTLPRSPRPAEAAPAADARTAAIDDAEVPDDDFGAELLAGRYRIVRLLGQGGMGQVFEAIDTRRGDARVAIKRMNQTDMKGIVRLKREYRRMEGIGHPNLVALHGLGEHQGRPFIVMEHVVGTDFYTGVGRRAGEIADMGRLRALTRQLTLGVMALHDAGRVHRDLKGANVLVTSQGRVVVLDFGLVDEVERRTLFTSSLGRVVGTVLYMPPEQAAGQLPGPSCDWYALGVMLHVATVGRYPFEGGPYEVLVAKQSSEAPRLRTFDPEVPADLDDLVARLLRPEPSHRATGLDVLAWCERTPAAPRRGGPRPVLSTPLLGRRRQTEQLAGALAYFMQQRVPLRIDITGPAGTGKTELVRRFLEPLRVDPEFLVFAGRCYEFDSVPFKAFDHLIEGLARHLAHLPEVELLPLIDEGTRALARLFPTLRRLGAAVGEGEDVGSTAALRQQAFRGLRNLLHRLATRARLVLAVDDLQWGDVDSARLIGDLLAPPGAPPLLFVMAYRDEDAGTSPSLRELAALESARSNQHEPIRIRTEPLDNDAARELAARMIGGGDPLGLSARIADEAQGNPMLIEALVRDLDEGDPGALVRTGGLSLEALVARRLARLDPEATRMLEAIAVAGQPIAPELAARAAGLSDDPRAALTQLRAHHMIRSAGEQDVLECYHQQVGRATLARLSAEALMRRHRDMASALVQAGVDQPERLAHHWFAAGERELAGEAATEAGELAARTCAFDRAARLFRIAANCRPDQAGLRRKLAAALVAAGRSSDAAPLLLEAAIQSGRPAVARRLRREAGEHWMVAGQLAKGIEALRPLMTELEISYPESESAVQQQLAGTLSRLVRRKLAWVERSEMELPSRDLERHDLYWSLCKGHMLVDMGRGGLFAAHSALLALELGEPRRIARGLALVGAIGLERGETEGRAWLKEAEEIADAIGDAYAAAFVSLCWGLVYRGAGAWSRTLASLESAFTRLPAGTAWEQDLASASLLATLEALGELPTLALRSQQIVQVARDLGSQRMVCLGLAYSALTALAGDDLTRVDARLQELSRALVGEEFQVVHLHALKVAVDRDLYVGSPRAAWERLAALWPAIERSSVMKTALRRLMAISLRARAGLALLADGATGFDFVAEIVSQDVAQIEREQAVHARAFAGMLRAGVAAVGSDAAEVRRALWTAVADFDAAGMAVHATCGRRCLALWGATEEERAHLAAAESFLRIQGIARPDRWSAVLAPGLVPV